MTTTIQINEETKQMLMKIKEIENMETYNDVIVGLAKERLKVPNSLFGKGKGEITRFKKEDRLRLHEL
ncbi:MAG: hypothetical protein ABII01_02155 [Candidatus Woesearchaeota archaeon]